MTGTPPAAGEGKASLTSAAAGRSRPDSTSLVKITIRSADAAAASDAAAAAADDDDDDGLMTAG
jgi:hypothetical protein